MKYVAHHRFKEIALCGPVNIPYGTELVADGNCIMTLEGKPVCYDTSENARMYFSRNDDGRGLERGGITYAIAYSQRERYSEDGRRQRFTDAEIDLLEREWSHFLQQDASVI
ncbi:MAG: hypothetical protein Q4C28_15360, partial [Escherichia coli]|nr:hypothetical protein [Escherichia coli]